MGSSVSIVGVKEALEELKDCRKVKNLEDEFWNSDFLQNRIDLKDLIQVVPLDQIRDLKMKNRTNFKNFCLYCMNKIYIYSQSAVWAASETLLFNNCVIWLVRLFPVILEDREMINCLWELKNEANQQSYASNLIQNITESLFRPGFTVSKVGELYAQPDPMNTCLIWKPGLVITEPCETTDFFLEMRLHLLSLLLMTLSQELFFIYEESMVLEDRFSLWFKSKSNKFAVLVFTSLMNFVISTANELKALWSYSKTNLRSISLLFSCLHVLMLCTCSKVDDVEDQKETKDKNVFVEIIQGLHKKEDIDQIITALYLLFKVTNTKKTAYSISFHQECLILLWRFCMINQKFIDYLLISPHMPNIILQILLYLYEIRNDPSEIGFIHTSLSLLLFLSSERQFALIMNSVYEGKPHYDLSRNCSYNDYLVYCLAKLMTRGPESLYNLHETIASIVYNISPFMSLVTMSSCLTMICMLETAINLLSQENQPGMFCKVISLLLDSFNNVLCFGYNNNSYLIFCIIISHKLFYKLESMANDPEKSHFFEEDNNQIVQNNSYSVFVAKNIIKFLDILVPQVEKLCEETDNFDEEKVAQFLKRSTIVGIVNKPSHILTRRFEVLETVIRWIHIYTWTVVYLRQNDPPLYQGSEINLFKKTS